MRKLTLLFAVVGVLFTASAARAQQGGYGMAGCGLGSLLFGNDNTTLMQILAATTNGLFGSQTFGITSGTSNCTAGLVTPTTRQIGSAIVPMGDGLAPAGRSSATLMVVSGRLSPVRFAHTLGFAAMAGDAANAMASTTLYRFGFMLSPWYAC